MFSIFISASEGVQHADIVIGGDSMLARLLRKTIGAFNTSSNLDVQSSNLRRLSTIWVSIFFLQVRNLHDKFWTKEIILENLRAS